MKRFFWPLIAFGIPTVLMFFDLISGWTAVGIFFGIMIIVLIAEQFISKRET